METYKIYVDIAGDLIQVMDGNGGLGYWVWVNGDIRPHSEDTPAYNINGGLGIVTIIKPHLWGGNAEECDEFVKTWQLQKLLDN